MTGDVQLREVAEADLPIFYEHQLDPEATRMAAFPARDRQAFMAHWARILADATIAKQTILVDGQVAGNLVAFGRPEAREVGYWIARQYWGRGIATRALAQFLVLVKERPLYAHVAKHNRASFRVLEKCGFTLFGEDKEFSRAGGQVVEGLVLILRANETEEAGPAARAQRSPRGQSDTGGRSGGWAARGG